MKKKELFAIALSALLVIDGALVGASRIPAALAESTAGEAAEQEQEIVIVTDPVELPEVGEPDAGTPEEASDALDEQETDEAEQTGGLDNESEVQEPEVQDPEVQEPEVQEPEVQEPEVQDPETQEPETPALSSYAIVGAGTILYADPQRTTHLGRLTVDTALHVRNVGDYGDAAVYEVIFDTDRTAGAEHYETAYFYTANLRSLTVAQAAALSADRTSESGARVLYADFIYEEADETAAEEGGKTQLPDETTDEAPEGEETTGDETEDEAPEESEEASEPHTNINQVNIRKAPSISSDIVAKLTQGTAITVIETVTNDAGEAWHKVTCAQGSGYIRADLISGAAEVSPEETVEETIEETEAEATEKPVEAVESEAAEDSILPPAEDSLTEEPTLDEEAEEEIQEETPVEADELFPTEIGEEAEEAPEADGQPAEEEEEELIFVDERKVLSMADELDPNRTIDIYAYWEGEQLYFGDVATLHAVLTGYDNAAYTLQWQTGSDGASWTDIPGATGTSYAVTVTEDNYLDYWRVVVTITDVE